MLKIWFALQYRWGAVRLCADSPEYGWTPDSGPLQTRHLPKRRRGGIEQLDGPMGEALWRDAETQVPGTDISWWCASGCGCQLSALTDAETSMDGCIPR